MVTQNILRTHQGKYVSPEKSQICMREGVERQRQKKETETETERQIEREEGNPIEAETF